jgi:hypothetical protein
MEDQMRSALTLAAGLFCLAGASAQAQDATMTGNDLHLLLDAGKTITLGGPGLGYSGQLVLNADGTGQGSATHEDDGSVVELTGTWRIDGNQFCGTWRTEAPEVCETWVKVGENKVTVIADGKTVGANSW